MPFVGLGLHILLALFCAFHVVRHGQQLFWLIILFSFPLLGSVVYLFVIVLPNSRVQHGARRAVRSAAQALDPGRALREAQADFDDTPTAQNQMRLAAALLDAGQPEQAALQYEACLKGPFAQDQDIRFGAARAGVESGRFGPALEHLQTLRAAQPSFRAEAVALLTARSLAGLDRQAEAKAEFELAVSRFGSVEAMAEYAIWALDRGDRITAQPLLEQIDKASARWNAMARQLNEPVMRRLRAIRH